jgi:hypothetical protein
MPSFGVGRRGRSAGKSVRSDDRDAQRATITRRGALQRFGRLSLIATASAGLTSLLGTTSARAAVCCGPAYRWEGYCNPRCGTGHCCFLTCAGYRCIPFSCAIIDVSNYCVTYS